MVQRGKRFVAVTIGIAMTREVLGAGHDPLTLETPELVAGHLVDLVDIRPQRTLTNDGICRVGVHIHHRTEVHVDAQGTRFLPQRFAIGPC